MPGHLLLAAVSVLKQNNPEPHLSKQLHELGILIAVHLDLVDQLRLQLARGCKGAEELAPSLDLNIKSNESVCTSNYTFCLAAGKPAGRLFVVGFSVVIKVPRSLPYPLSWRERRTTSIPQQTNRYSVVRRKYHLFGACVSTQVATPLLRHDDENEEETANDFIGRQQAQKTSRLSCGLAEVSIPWCSSNRPAASPIS
jgi:hypothetical protein